MATPNPFDRFDTPAGNPFDVFDESLQPRGPSLAARATEGVRGLRRDLQTSLDSIGSEPASGPRRRLGPQTVGRSTRTFPTVDELRGAVAGETLREAGGLMRGVSRAFEEPVVRMGARLGVPEELARELTITRPLTRPAQEVGSRFTEAGEQTLALTQPAKPSFAQRQVLGAARSLPAMGTAIAVGLPARSIGAAATTAGASQYGAAYGEAEEANRIRAQYGKRPLKEGEKQAYATLTGFIEGLMEAAPAAVILKRGTPAMKRLLQLTGVDVPSEIATSAMQQLVAEKAQISGPLSREQWHQLVTDTTVQTALLAGGATAVASAADRRRPPIVAERGPSPDEFVTETESLYGNPFDRFDSPQDVPLSAAPEGVEVDAPTAARGQFSDPVEADPLAPAPVSRPLGQRLADTQIRAELERMAGETGWLEKGGRLLRNEATGEVTGRTSWIPRAEWWAERPKGLTEKQAQVAIGKALAGQLLTKRETSLLDFMTEVAATRKAIDPFIPTPEELGGEGLTPSGNDAFETALVTRATEIDEVAVERAAMRYENDPDGFLAEIRRIVQQGTRDDARGQEGAGAQEARTGEASEPAAPQAVTDLFGGKTATQQQIFDAQQARARKERDAQPVGMGAGNLFTSASRQTELEDAAKAPSQDNPFDQFDAEAASGVQKAVGAQYVPLLQALPTVSQQNQITIAPGTSLERAVAIPKEPVRREHIMRDVQRLFAMHVYQGGPFKQSRTTLGFFRPRTGEVRTKKKNDLEVTAHEFFHWLDRAFPTIRKLYQEPKFRDELKAVSYDQKLLFEGFAEFGRLFLTQTDQAASRTPTFYKAFIAEAEKADILDKLLRVQERMHQWYYQGAEGRARSKIGTPPPNLKQQWEEATDRIGDRAIQQSLDFLQAFKVVEREVSGTVRDATVSPYKSARLVAGARGVTRAVLNHGTIRWDANGDIEFTGPGLKQVFDPVADIIDDVMAYFAGRRAQELASQGREHLFSKDEIKALVAIGHTHPKQAAIRQAFIEYQKFQDRQLDFYQQSGLIADGHRRMMQKMNAAYVPFHRILETLEKGATTPRQDQFKRLKGGTENVRDIFENIVGSVQALTTAALRNHAKLQLYSLIETSRSGAKFAARVAAEERPTKIDPEWLIRQIKRYVFDQQAAEQLEKLIRAHPEFGDMVLYWSGQYAPDAPDLDVVLANGKPRYYQIGDPLLMETMELFNRHQPLALALRLMGYAANGLRRGVTMMPDFQIPNLLRDSFNAFALSKGKQLPLVSALRGMVQRLRNDKDYWEFLANGGGFSSQLHGDLATPLRTRLERYYVDRHIDYRTVLDSPRKLLDAWDEIASAFEYGTRLAEYKKLRKRGASRREAAFEGREISTDFGMRGASDFLRVFTVSVPFLNARMQGLYRLQREVGERDGRIAFNPRQSRVFAMRALLGVTIPSILLWWLFHDDERVKALPEWVKLSHWTIPTGDKVFLIPKPFEIGAMFATVPEQTLEYLEKRDGPKFAEAMGFLFANAFGFNPTPQAVKPLVDVARNKSWAGAPIVSESLKDVVPTEQFTPWTSETMMRLARTMPESAPDLLRSPAKLDYLMRGYLGTFGQYVLSTSDALLSGADWAMGVETPETGPQPTGSVSDTYVLRRFIRQAPYRGTAYEEEFYKVLEQTREAVATLRKIERDQRFKDVEEMVADAETRVLLALSGQNVTSQRRDVPKQGAEQIAKRASEINSLMNRVRLSPDLSADEKRAQLDKLQYEKNLLFDAASTVFSRQNVRALQDQVSR